MKRLVRILALVLGLQLMVQSAFADDVLLGVTGAGANTNSIAYTIDGETGEATELGQLTYDGTNLKAIASMALNPADGYIYFTNNTGRGADTNKALYRIELDRLLSGDTAVDRVAVIGGQGIAQTPDMTFTDDGKLYVWSENNDNPMLINPETGVVISEIESDFGSWATGIAFDENGLLWVKAGDNLGWIELSVDGESANDEFNNFNNFFITWPDGFEYNDEYGYSNMLSRANDGTFWSGIRADDGSEDGNTVLWQFVPGTDASPLATIKGVVTGVHLSAIEWIRSATKPGKDRNFWTAVEDCRTDLSSDLAAGKDVSASTFQSCFFTGVNSANSASVNAQLKSAIAAAAKAGKEMDQTEIIRTAAQIADRLDLVQRLSTGKLVFASEFTSAGINLGALPTKTLDALKALPASEIDTLEEVLAQIAKVA